MKQSAKHAARITALTLALAVSLTGCCWEDYFGSASSDVTGGVSDSSNGGIHIFPGFGPGDDDNGKDDGGTTDPDTGDNGDTKLDDDEDEGDDTNKEPVTTSDASYTVVDAVNNTVRLKSVDENANTFKIGEDKKITASDGTIYTVVGIDKDAFSGATKLKNIEVPASLCGNDLNEALGVSNAGKDRNFNLTITGKGKVPEGSFYDNDNIIAVSFGEEITEIGKDAFKGCDTLIKIKWGSVETIGESAFEGSGIKSSESLGYEDYASTHLVISANEIKDNAFKDCKKIEFVWLTGSVNKIGAYAFSGTEAKQYTFTKKIDDVGTKAFEGCNAEIVEFKGGTKEEFEAWYNSVLKNCGLTYSKLEVN